MKKPIKRKPRKRRKKGEIPSISRLIKEADSLFSKQVRMKGAFGNITENLMYGTPVDWENKCFTCKNTYPTRKLHCGHYLSRYYKAARWNFDNARPQCMMCNMWKRGDPVVFRRNLIREIGEARVLAVEALRDAPTKLSREFLEDLIKTLKEPTHDKE